MKLHLVIRPRMKGTPVPQFYYTFAETPEEAIKKVEYKWGDYDEGTTARVLRDVELEELVVGTDFY